MKLHIGSSSPAGLKRRASQVYLHRSPVHRSKEYRLRNAQGQQAKGHRFEMEDQPAPIVEEQL